MPCTIREMDCPVYTNDDVPDHLAQIDSLAFIVPKHARKATASEPGVLHDLVTCPATKSRAQTSCTTLQVEGGCNTGNPSMWQVKVALITINPKRSL
jgi:hypothetical protein